MANTTSLSLVATTLNVANIPTLTPMTTTIMTTPTATLTMNSPTNPISPTISIPTTPVIVHNTQGNCLPQAPGYGPIPSEDNMHSFHTSLLLRSPALDATTPYGYSLAFREANASYIGIEYLGFYELQAYSTAECASRCLSWGISATQGEPKPRSALLFPEGFDFSATPTYTPTLPTQVCNSFNIYFERSPAINLGPECKNADSRTIIKCALWGEGDMQKEGATNTGYREWDFEVVIAGSNGYRYGTEENDNVKKSDGEKTVTLIIAMEAVRKIMVSGAVGLLIVGAMGFLED